MTIYDITAHPPENEIEGHLLRAFVAATADGDDYAQDQLVEARAALYERYPASDLTEQSQTELQIGLAIIDMITGILYEDTPEAAIPLLQRASEILECRQVFHAYFLCQQHIGRILGNEMADLQDLDKACEHLAVAQVGFATNGYFDESVMACQHTIQVLAVAWLNTTERTPEFCQNVTTRLLRNINILRQSAALTKNASWALTADLYDSIRIVHLADMPAVDIQPHMWRLEQACQLVDKYLFDADLPQAANSILQFLGVVSAWGQLALQDGRDDILGAVLAHNVTLRGQQLMVAQLSENEDVLLQAQLALADTLLYAAEVVESFEDDYGKAFEYRSLGRQHVLEAICLAEQMDADIHPYYYKVLASLDAHLGTDYGIDET